MNNLKLKLGFILLLAGSLAAASADPVVFNVNMSVQTALGNFDAGNGDTVWVLGLNGDWTTGIDMVPSVADANIYTVTDSLTAGSYPDYLFVIKPGNNGAWDWESPANFGGDDRWFEVPAGGTNLPVVYFSDNTNLPSGSVSITFQVDMTSAIQAGDFTIGSDYVDAYGSFNNWSSTGVLLSNVTGTSNYVGTLVTSALSVNTVVFYKYAIDGGNLWEGNVGPDGASDRSFTVTNTTQTLSQDYWDDLTNVSATYNVTFTADMTAQTALGIFVPGTDAVFVSGDWNWSSSQTELVQDLSGSNTNLYTNTVTMDFTPGTTVDYKFSLDDGLVWENNGVGPAGANDREFGMTSDTNLPASYFNNVANLGPITVTPASAQAVLYWPSGTNVNSSIRVQSSGSVTGPWSDVSGTQGQSSVTNNFGPDSMFFRLIGP